MKRKLIAVLLATMMAVSLAGCGGGDAGGSGSSGSAGAESGAVQYMHSGQIMDMGGLIDQYGTNLKGIFGEDTLKGNSVDGFVYGRKGV